MDQLFKNTSKTQCRQADFSTRSRVSVGKNTAYTETLIVKIELDLFSSVSPTFIQMVCFFIGGQCHH